MVTDIILRPRVGTFDVELICAHLDSMPHTRRDPVAGVMYMLAGSETELDHALRAREADPTEFPTSVILVGVAAGQIVIGYRTTEVEPARSLVTWLRAQWDLAYLDEEFNDLTGETGDRLELLFGPPPVLGEST